MDFKTLIAMNVFGLVLCAVALIMNAVGGRTVRIPLPMVLCSLSAATGMLLLMCFGRVSNFLSVVVGSFCVQLAFMFMYRGYSWMAQAPKRARRVRGWQVLLMTTLASTAGIAYFTVVSPAVEPRVVIFSISMIFSTLACIALLLRVPDVFLREASWLSILCLGMYTMASLLRLITVLRHPPMVSLLESDGPEPGFFLINLIALAGLTYGHIWITGARQRMVLQSQAHTDELTGALNRRAIEIEAGREISRARRGQRPLAVMMCDLDKFKAANDALGHHYGDAVLQAVATALRSALRREDLIARLGGDEFVVLLPDTTRDKAMEVAERLRADIQRLHVVEQGRHSNLYASFGLAMLDDIEGDTWRALVDRADAALYVAKQTGGNSILMDFPRSGPKLVIEDEQPQAEITRDASPASQQRKPAPPRSGPTIIH